VRFKVFMVISTKIAVLWDVALCSLGRYRLFHPDNGGSKLH
jgi:hypothetical protein